MITKTFYPGTVSQTNNSNNRQFSNIANIKKYKDYAQSNGLIAGKTGTRNKPSTITCTNFNVSLPTGSEISSIKVEYAHEKVSYQGGTPNIPAPTIDLVNVSASALSGKAPTTTMKENSVTFKVSPALNKVTSSSFGVQISYPKNANTNPGYLRVKYVRVVITYKSPSYSISLSKSTSTPYKGDTLTIKATINNKNTTAYNPSVNITLPSSNVTYTGKSGDGTVTTSGANLVWKPGITAKTKSCTVSIKLQLNNLSTSNKVTFTEPTTGATKNITFNITEKPETVIDDETDTDESPKNNEVTNYITLFGPDHTYLYFDMVFTPEEFETAKENNGGEFFRWSRYANPTFSKNTFTPEDTCWDRGTILFSNFDVDGYDQNYWYITNQSNSTYIVWAGDEYDSDMLLRVDISIYPKSVTYPTCTILELSNEELNRLGDGFVYKLQTYMKETTTDTFVREWPKSFMVGVFNNAIEANQSIFITIDEETGKQHTEIIDGTDYNNLEIGDIIDNAAYWSPVLTKVNEFESLEVEFPYNEEYPFYVLILGDYPESSNPASITFTEPIIVEEDDYTGYIKNGIYPEPILSTIVSTDNIATQVVPEYDIGSPIIAYDLPLSELNEEEDFIVKGVEVSFDVDYTDQLIISCKLRNHNGVTGERSIVVNPITQNTVTIGDPTDRWGFTESQLREFDKWEIEIQANNLFDNEQNESTILFDNITFTLHTTELDSQLVTCLIDGENLAGYNAFITDIEVPAGLETETKYLNVDGTDTNEAYRQNIREKEIKLSFDIDACNIDEATSYLQEITHLLVNDRDNINNPIPKTLEFSHYPGIYWEYVMEKPIKTDANASNYECEATLTVPHGTAYTKEEIVTGASGKVNGIAKINPKIVIIPTNEHIEILETTTNQKFLMTYNGWTNEDLVEINCANRSVLLDKPGEENLIDITAYTDFNSDWFKIIGEYHFEPTGCIIQTISRIERR